MVKIRRIKKKRKNLAQRRLRLVVLMTALAILTTNIIQCAGNFGSQAVGTVEPMVMPGSFTTQIESTEIVFGVPTGYQGKIIHKVEPNGQEKLVALTFDDGPWINTTTEVLEILRKNEIKATFFVLGQQLQKYPQIANQVIAEGHAIANHTWHHWYRRMDEATAAKEIDDTANLIYKTTGVKTNYFRPPGGVLNNGLVSYAQKRDYAIAMWSVDSADSRRRRPTPETLAKNVLKGIHPGGIVLMHDGGGNHEATVQALPQIIEGLREQGYKFVTLPELLASSQSSSQTHE